MINLNKIINEAAPRRRSGYRRVDYEVFSSEDRCVGSVEGGNAHVPHGNS